MKYHTIKFISPNKNNNYRYEIYFYRYTKPLFVLTSDTEENIIDLFYQFTWNKYAQQRKNELRLKKIIEITEKNTYTDTIKLNVA